MKEVSCVQILLSILTRVKSVEKGMCTEQTVPVGSGKCDFCGGELVSVDSRNLFECPKCKAYYDVRDGRKYFLSKYGNQPCKQ